MTMGGKSVKLNLFDTAGQERYRTLTSSYYRRSHGVCFVFDVTDRVSFENLQKWMDEASQYLDPNEYERVLIANKVDLVRVAQQRKKADQ